ncbi:SDR family NAD(P)-dependent oxidoreductase [Paenibacillus solani]|uniref:SDR family NAD(P)-dependent oxidoreductase n=1 Tax=Paenibacillus solani TaxID=1705565 RepID=UPI0006C8BA56|nr:glucose 1-dehydrogenase [Paenibacillus solani]
MMAIDVRVLEQPDLTSKIRDELVLDQEAHKLVGQWALVTGAGRGIGAEIAEQFARKGASLVLTELPELMEQAEDVAGRIRDRYGVGTYCEELDLRNNEGVERCIRSIEEQGVDLRYLINNAGVNLLQPALNLTREEWDFVVDINLKGTFFLTQEVAKIMVRNKKGSIVMIASQHGVVANENRAPYCASKAGLIHLTKSLAMEWAKYGIRVNAVSPTFVVTDANQSIIQNAQFQRTNLPKIPLRKFAEPEDVANAVLFLATDAAGMITGHNLIVDGGWTIQ